MTKTSKKISAIIILVALIVVPFIDWKLGAVLWMCAWFIFIFQNLFPKHAWKFEEGNPDEEKEPE